MAGTALRALQASVQRWLAQGEMRQQVYLFNIRTNQIPGKFENEIKTRPSILFAQGHFQRGEINRILDSLVLRSSFHGVSLASKCGGTLDTRSNFPASQKRRAERFFQRMS
jgi:hypothetical protein